METGRRHGQDLHLFDHASLCDRTVCDRLRRARRGSANSDESRRLRVRPRENRFTGTTDMEGHGWQWHTPVALFHAESTGEEKHMSSANVTDAGLASFSTEVREWLEENFPPALKGKQQMIMMPDAGSVRDKDYDRWRAAMGERGWGTPTWPAQYGGGGLNREQARLLQQEMNRIGAWNPIGGMGVMMFGPTLLEYGSEEQKRRHIPGIVRGEVRWCQGYSEPGAGSDLAALRTQCVAAGDYFVVNGQKIWTSGAQWADWCFCLVRTDNSKKHEGISFLLIDMTSPGIEVRPIKLISGNSPFCEVFFTDVKVPKGNLIGALNGGWTIGKRLLQHERTSLSGGSQQRSSNEATLDQLAKSYVGA